MKGAPHAHEAAPTTAPAQMNAKNAPEAARVQSLIGNFAMQRLLRSAVSPVSDPLEEEADRAADTVMGIGGSLGTRPRLEAAAPGISQACGCAANDEEKCETCSRNDMPIRRNAAGPAPPAVPAPAMTGGAPLPESTRTFMEERFGADFRDVRIHTGGEAAIAAQTVSAHAFTIGSDIAFARNAFHPTSKSGQRLLAHELAHVLQQRDRGLHLQRSPDPSARQTAPLAARIAAFQRLVKNAGKLRLDANSRALDQWRDFIQLQLTPSQVAAQVHSEEVRSLLERASRQGGTEMALAEQWLQTPGPNRRWVLEQQIGGRYRACTGCHATVQADKMDFALQEKQGPYATPLQQILSRLEGGPRPSFAEGEQIPGSGLPGFPHVAEAQQRINAIGPYLRRLGPDGYQVLPPETLGSTVAPSALVADISRRITRRQADYREFRGRIDAPGFDYLQLRPIVRDLLLLADPDVREAVQSAIDSAETWAIVESIVVGAATIGLLILAIFPPTSALGIAGALALGAAVGGYQVYSGIESYQQGHLYSLGRGAHDVLDRAQQEAADSLMAAGALNVVLGSIGVAISALGTVRIIRAAVPPGGGALGAMESVEGNVGGNLYRVQFGSRDPHVVVTNARGQVIREGPLSSFRGGSQASGGGGYVYPTEGGAALQAQPVPQPVRLQVAQPDATRVAPAFPPIDLRATLATSGTASALGMAATRQPVMPAGLSAADQALWRRCSALHDTYKATQDQASAYAASMDPIRHRIMQNLATPQERLVYCLFLDERIRLVQRLHQERSRYIQLDCDRFDWFNTGTTAAERLRQHQIELENVDAQLRNLYDLRNRICL